MTSSRPYAYSTRSNPPFSPKSPRLVNVFKDKLDIPTLQGISRLLFEAKNSSRSRAVKVADKGTSKGPNPVRSRPTALHEGFSRSTNSNETTKDASKPVLLNKITQMKFSAAGTTELGKEGSPIGSKCKTCKVHPENVDEQEEEPPIIKPPAVLAFKTPNRNQMNFATHEDRESRNAKIRSETERVVLAHSSQLVRIIDEKDAIIEKMLKEKRQLEAELEKLKSTTADPPKPKKRMLNEPEKVKNLIDQLRVLTQFNKKKPTLRNLGAHMVTTPKLNDRKNRNLLLSGDNSRTEHAPPKVQCTKVPQSTKAIEGKKFLFLQSPRNDTNKVASGAHLLNRLRNSISGTAPNGFEQAEKRKPNPKYKGQFAEQLMGLKRKIAKLVQIANEQTKLLYFTEAK